MTSENSGAAGRRVIATDRAPQAIGAYSQAVRVGDLVFVSGQIPLAPDTGEVVGENDADAAIRQVFENFLAVCEAAGGSSDSVAKLTVYLTDLALFPRVNEIMGAYFSPPYPARAAVEVAGLPKGVAVEVEGILSLVS